MTGGFEMVYRLIKDGIEQNRIESDESFAADYAAKQGYTYEVVDQPLEKETPSKDDSTVWDEMAAALSEGVNSIDE
jgi:hypothetical protein